MSPSGSRWWVLALCLLLAGCDDTTAQQHLERARDLLADGDLGAGVIELRNAVRKAPDLGAAQALLGEALARQGDHAGALRAYRRALDRGVGEPEVQVGLYDAQVRTGQHQRVIEALSGRTGLSAGEDLVLADAELAADRIEAARARYLRHPDRSAAQLGLGRIAAFSGDLNEATRRFEQALAIDPDNGEARLGLGQVALSLGQLEPAEAAFQAALADEALRVPANLGLARTRLAENDPQAAARYAGVVVRLAPDYLAGHYLLSQAALAEGDLKAARTALDKVLERAPSNVAALYLLANLEARAGNEAAAIRTLERALAGHPDHEDSRLLLASLYLAAQDPGAAVRILETLADQGRNARALALYGTAMLELDNADAAAAAFEAAVALAPDAAALRNQLALSLAASGELTAAESQLQEALNLDAGQARSDYLLAMIRLGQGDWDGALAGARSLKAKDPGNPLGDHLAGSAYLAAGDLVQARGSFEAALTVDPDYLPAIHGLARVAGRQDGADGAAAIYRGYLDTHPDRVEVRLALAELALASGDPDAALSHLESAAASDPNSAAARLALAEAYARSGRLQEARRQIEAARQQAPAHPGVRLLEARIALEQQRPQDARLAVTALQQRLDGGARDPGLRLAVADLMARLGMVGPARANLRQVLDDSQGTSVPALQALVRLDLRDGNVRAAGERLATLEQLGDQSEENRLLRADLNTASGRAAEALADYRTLAAGGNRTALLRLVRLAPEDAAAVAALNAWVEALPEDRDARRLLADVVVAAAPERARRLYEGLLPSDDPALLNNLAWLYQAAGDDRAETLARQALVQAPGNPSVLDTLGWILVQSDRSAEAVPLLRQSLRVAPGNPSVLYHLGVALRDSGDPASARTTLERALAGGEFPEADAARAALQALADV